MAKRKLEWRCRGLTSAAANVAGVFDHRAQQLGVRD
jgi:hypothetical protein